MRILFVVDGRSPIALNWIGYFIRGDHEIHLVSTFPCQPPQGLATFWMTPVAFSGVKTTLGRIASRKDQLAGRNWLGQAGWVGLRTRLRQWLGLLTFSGANRRLAEVVRQVQPDLIHAMRIPYEGIITAMAVERLSSMPRLLISVWGNDFTLHATANPWMGAFTRRALKQASALHTDCLRDQRLAYQWGFQAGKPAVVLPGGGGVQMDQFFPPSERQAGNLRVINPRGVRAYVRNDTFFKAIPRVLEKFPTARFICPAMAGEPQVMRWLRELRIEGSVELLPPQPREDMAYLFRQAQVAVSPSTHDGTPNTLLEAMACGCYPVAGDIESLREWITPGLNGALVDPGDAGGLAEAICEGLENTELRRKAAAYNLALVAERAEYSKVMQLAESFYERIAG